MLIYTERDTRFLYEIKLFDEYALVRPLRRGCDTPVEKLHYGDLHRRFEEFLGDTERALEIFEGEVPISSES